MGIPHIATVTTGEIDGLALIANKHTPKGGRTTLGASNRLPVNAIRNVNHDDSYFLLRPNSVAVVGASARADSMGEWSLTNLKRGGFAGNIYI